MKVGALGDWLIDRLRQFPLWLWLTLDEHWVWLASVLAVASAGVIGVWQFLPNSDVDSARWTLSAMVQATAAIFGITFVGLVFLWTEAERSLDRLLSLRREYVARLSEERVNVEEKREGGRSGPWARLLKITGTHSRPMTDLEHYLKQLRELLETEKATDISGGAWHQTPNEWMEDVAVLRRAVEFLRDPGSKAFGKEDVSDLVEGRLAGSLRVGARADVALRDPVEFFTLVTDVFSLNHLLPDGVGTALGWKTAELMHEMNKRIWRDEIPTLLRRVARMRRLRGWIMRLAIVALTAAIAWGLAILVGYDDSTPNEILVLPVAAGLLGTVLVAVLAGRLLTAE